MLCFREITLVGHQWERAIPGMVIKVGSYFKKQHDDHFAFEISFYASLNFTAWTQLNTIDICKSHNPQKQADEAVYKCKHEQIFF